ncbi:MAG: sigma 54 modulation/S30EA ribosomal C-terminal domain-containing protein, partial [Negativicutes bacterium]|nr:sigma 54 modulation/S30EA ribosomal C-terminal domain-containing protein [Negativicutes bacterium]
KQIEKYKTRLAKKFRAGGKQPVSDGDIPVTETDDVADFKIVKTKRFAIKPMDVKEAVMQMNLINHDFYVFINAQTE